MKFILDFSAFESEEKAVSVSSVEEEYEWVKRHALIHFGISDAFPIKQELHVKENKAFDKLILELRNGAIREYWFDISSFYEERKDIFDPIKDNKNNEQKDPYDLTRELYKYHATAALSRYLAEHPETQKNTDSKIIDLNSYNASLPKRIR